jgi:hypothetical protein
LTPISVVDGRDAAIDVTEPTLVCLVELIERCLMDVATEEEVIDERLLRGDVAATEDAVLVCPLERRVFVLETAVLCPLDTTAEGTDD